jgi:competence ComEA-like helix-hairpin-helix protein
MIKEAVSFVLIIFLVLSVSAQCSEGQIDINSASAEELNQITQVGPATAEAIINSRPFNSIDGLLEVSGIGEKKLEKIKEEGLACVEKEETNVEEELEKESSEEILTPIRLSTNLNSKDIKSEDNKGILVKNLALCGIIGFCLVFGALFSFKFVRKSKNEFR